MQMKHVFPQYISEFIGTFFLVFFGCGSAILLQVNPSSVETLSIPVAFGGVVSVMIYAVGHISGAHFNPAVTIAFWAVKRFPTYRVLGYLISQILGALLASFVHSIIWESGHNFAMTGVSIGTGPGFLVEFILSFSLMFVIISVATDSRAVGELAGIAIGTTVLICALVGGPLTGASMNPARSIAPAIMSGNFHLLWLYIFAPIIGAVLAAFVYEKIRCSKDEASQNEDTSPDHGCC